MWRPALLAVAAVLQGVPSSSSTSTSDTQLAASDPLVHWVGRTATGAELGAGNPSAVYFDWEGVSASVDVANYDSPKPTCLFSNPFSALKGFNYFPAASMNDIDFWRDYREDSIERELGWAAAAGLNFCRTWFNFVVWQHEGAGSMRKLQHFVASAHALGIKVMLAPFNNYYSCVSTSGGEPRYDFTAPCFYTSPAVAHALNTSWWHDEGHAYVDALTAALPASTPGLLLWDVCNEPSAEWQPFVLHFVRYFQSKTTTPTTVGIEGSTMNMGPIGQAVDVMSFHTYFPSWEVGLKACDDATATAERLDKHVFLSEFGCIARANAYHQGIELASLWGMGWTLWELMVLDRESEQGTINRRNIHGIIYSDGSVRDTAAIAAVRGFYPNRGTGTAAIAPGVPNEENHAAGAIAASNAWTAQSPSQQLGDFVAAADILGTIANLLEASGTTPMSLPVSGFARGIFSGPPTEERRAALEKMLATGLKHWGACGIVFRTRQNEDLYNHHTIPQCITTIRFTLGSAVGIVVTRGILRARNHCDLRMLNIGPGSPRKPMRCGPQWTGRWGPTLVLQATTRLSTIRGSRASRSSIGQTTEGHRERGRVASQMSWPCVGEWSTEDVWENHSMTVYGCNQETRKGV